MTSEPPNCGIRELECSRQPRRVEEIDAEGYLAANPDVVQVGMTAEDHFLTYGQKEGRIQYMNMEGIRRLRAEKLARLKFRRAPNQPPEPGGPMDFLPADAAHLFKIPERPPISANVYGENLLDQFRHNPDQLFLDVGAGLRHSYFHNVVNTEIFPLQGVDVVCVGEDLPFEDNTFDMALAIAVLEHTRRPWEVAREIARVVKPGGEILIDYPFLQPFHGYPYHYFNATPEGHRSLFEEYCDIKSVEVRPNQAPIAALHWMLELWQLGLAPSDARKFGRLRIRDILKKSREEHQKEGYCRNLDGETVRLIAAGTTLRAIKKG